jgi:hypothetical protein
MLYIIPVLCVYKSVCSHGVFARDEGAAVCEIYGLLSSD